MINLCLNCNKETTNPKFCSKSCSAKITNKTPKRKAQKHCVKCNKPLKNKKSVFCSEHFHEDMLNKKHCFENLTLLDYVEKTSIKKLAISSKFAPIRNFARSWNKNKTKLPCYNCGYSKHVELCHIKALSSFPLTAKLSEVNHSTNIVQLCPNCHWEFDNNLLILDLSNNF